MRAFDGCSAICGRAAVFSWRLVLVFAMPLRQMLYDVLKYENQRARLEREHRQKKDLKGPEYLSGMAKKDRLIPVVTITVDWGNKAWDGAKSLYEMLDIPPVLSQYKDIINDYRLNLLEVSYMENIEAYSGELKALLGFVRYQQDGTALDRFIASNSELFQTLTPETIRAISVLGNARELESYLEHQSENENEEGIDMCQALQEMIMKGKAEGKAESILELLGELGPVPEDLQKKVSAQRDLGILGKWVKLAAAADSIQEFSDRI